jgi:hypothetical protein
VRACGLAVRIVPPTTRFTVTVTGLFAACGDVMTTLPVYVPAARLAKFETPILSAAGVVPLAALTVSQLPPLEVDAAAVKLTAAPLEVILIGWVAGEVLDPVCTLNVKEPGAAPRLGPDGAVAVTVSKKEADAFVPHESVAVTVKLEVPATVGVPAIA